MSRSRVAIYRHPFYAEHDKGLQPYFPCQPDKLRLRRLSIPASPQFTGGLWGCSKFLNVKLHDNPQLVNGSMDLILSVFWIELERGYRQDLS